MKYVFKYIFLIFISLNFIGCSKDNSNKIVDSLITTIPTTDIEIIPTLSLVPTNLPEEEIPNDTKNTDIDEY
ncbi:hypothetical protein [Clostridium sp. Marseille-P299]|uniref:hypothetical protein n=1 Tax=Clostridium sp. Marseille-P299 TaxID=1805477 RepID=UPI00082993B5|nr:hypothetical protein [Clostridium sp. Marseille-P299]